MNNINRQDRQKHIVCTQATNWPRLTFDRCVAMGSARGCAQVAPECSGCDATSLPASACTSVLKGPPTSTLPQCTPTKSDNAE
eukprot:1159502-Pelagomonas_calceolata.AAC.12